MDSNELFNRIGDIDNIDYRLIALNKGQEKYKFLYQNLNITNEVNGFLYGYSFYLKQRADKYNIELMKEISFHDGRIIECSLNNDKFGVISFTDGFQDNIKWTFNLYNYIYNGKKPENGYSIISGGYGNYENYKFILTIDEVDLIAEKIDVIKSII